MTQNKNGKISLKSEKDFKNQKENKQTFMHCLRLGTTSRWRKIWLSISQVHHTHMLYIPLT